MPPALNVLHAIHDFLPRHPAGSEIYAYDLCRALSARHHVTILAAEFDPLRANGEVEWRVHGGLPVVEIVNNWACRSFEESYRPPLIGERIGQVIDAVQPDVVHVHNLLNLSFDLPAMAKRRGTPVVATLHDYTLVCASGGQRLHQADAHVCHTIDADRCARCFRESPFFTRMSTARIARPASAFGPLYRMAASAVKRQPALLSLVSATSRRVGAMAVSEDDIRARLGAARQVFQDIDLFVAPSRSIADEFQRLGLPKEKIRVAAYGFPPLGHARPDTPRRRPDGPLRVGYVGSIVWHKGVHILLDAIRLLPRNKVDVAIYGDPDVSPEYAASLRSSAKGLPIQFLGSFDHERSGPIYEGLDVLVVPSIWLENSPLVIREAFLAGVVVIAARIGGLPELIDDGVTGLLFDPGSAADLARTLQGLIDEPGRLAVYRAALPPVRTVDDDARGWEAIYAEVIGARSPATDQ